jgi:hypothetical protein
MPWNSIYNTAFIQLLHSTISITMLYQNIIFTGFALSTTVQAAVNCYGPDRDQGDYVTCQLKTFTTKMRPHSWTSFTQRRLSMAPMILLSRSQWNAAKARCTMPKRLARTPVEILHASRSGRRSALTFSVPLFYASLSHQQSDQSCIDPSDANRQHLSRSRIQNSNLRSADQSDMPWSDGTARNATVTRSRVGTSTRVRLAIAVPDTQLRPLKSRAAQAIPGAQNLALTKKSPNVRTRHAFWPRRTVRPTKGQRCARRHFLNALQTRSR